MKLVKWIVLCGGLALAVPCWAEFYRYVDAQGNVHYTDDLTQVPENQQDTLKPYAEAAGAAKKTAGSPPVAATSPALPKSGGPDGQGKPDGQSAGRAEYDPREQGRQQTLEKDYQALLKEKASLEKEKEQVTRKSRAKRNRSVKALNKKLQSLNEKIDALQKRAEARQGADLLTNK